MGRRRIVTAVVIGLTLIGCGSSPPPLASPDWAAGAERAVQALEDAYDQQDPYATARFFSAGGTLDLSVWGFGIAETPGDVVEQVGNLWHQNNLEAAVRAEHVFVAPDKAFVWWHAFEPEGFTHWAQTYSFAGAGRTASRIYRALDVPMGDVGPIGQSLLDLSARYLEAWSSGQVSAIEGLYADDAVVRDDVRGLAWRSSQELVEGDFVSRLIEQGPWPRVFAYEQPGSLQAVVLFYVDDGCPMLEARHWVVSGELITSEVRYTHIPSARRCLSDLPEGWWAEFRLAPDLLDNPTEVIDTAGLTVELINAEPVHEVFTRWMLDRYLAAGLGLPEVGTVVFPPAPDCAELGGLAIESSDRYEGRHAVMVCFDRDRIESENSQYGWSPLAAEYGLHELAHIWMLEHLDDATRDAFNQRATLTVWRGSEAAWRDRGVEHAAFTIAWGLAGTIDARYPLLPVPACEELASRFRLLTGHEPLTECGEGGWSA